MLPSDRVTMTHSTSAYRREADISTDGLLYACHVTIHPTRAHERLDRYEYARQLGLIHFLLAPSILMDFYNNISSVIKPESPVFPERCTWVAWQRPAYCEETVRASCVLQPAVDLPFRDVIESFLHNESKHRYKRVSYW